jgi:GT2 family glycosyltransferase
MNLAIVIPCMNLWRRYTRPCLDSLNAGYPHRIILVDNGSTDETCEEAGRLVGPSFQHRRYETNSGTARSWNYGIADGFEKGADYVLVLNNDILCHPECINRMARRMQRNDVALATAFDVREEVAAPEDVFRIPADSKDGVAESAHPNFSAFALTRDCWETVGTFDEGFFPAYFEDNDYHRRIVLAGLKAVAHPPAMFYHYGSRTQNESGASPVVPGDLFEKNRAYYASKWGGPPGAESYATPFGAEIVGI